MRISGVRNLSFCIHPRYCSIYASALALICWLRYGGGCTLLRCCEHPAAVCPLPRCWCVCEMPRTCSMRINKSQRCALPRSAMRSLSFEHAYYLGTVRLCGARSCRRVVVAGRWAEHTYTHTRMFDSNCRAIRDGVCVCVCPRQQRCSRSEAIAIWCTRIPWAVQSFWAQPLKRPNNLIVEL